VCDLQNFGSKESKEQRVMELEDYFYGRDQFGCFPAMHVGI